jgi:hypothetical protein
MASELDRKAREDDDRSRRRLVESKRAAVMAARSGTPEPVPGRSHADIQTETFLEVSTGARRGRQVLRLEFREFACVLASSAAVGC